MKCPICKKEVTEMTYRPFCCKRCADVDLGNWFNESYKIPAVDLDEEEVEELVEELEKIESN